MHGKCEWPNGTCEFHGIMEERRKNDLQLLETIPGILSTQNKLIGGSRIFLLVFALMITATFSYTFMVKSDAKSDDIEIIQVQKENSNFIRELLIIQAKNERINSEIVNSLNRFNKIFEKWDNPKNKDVPPKKLGG